MKTLLAILLLSVAAFAQSPVPTQTFSFQSSAIALPGGKQTVAANDSGVMFAVTPNFTLRSDAVLSPGTPFSGYFGGLQYYLPALSKGLNNMSSFLNGNAFQFYLVGEAGIDRIDDGSNPVRQHYAFLAGGGVNYDPTASGHFTVNLIEVRYAKLPGYQNNTAIVKSGISVGF